MVTISEFIAEWRKVDLKERSPDLFDNAILESLLALNLAAAHAEGSAS